MSLSFVRMSDDIEQIFLATQKFIGRAIESSFGYTTSPAVNAVLIYAILLFLVVLAGRIFSAPPEAKWRTGALKSASGYDTRRNG